MSNLPASPLRVVITNAGECSYIEGWEDYRCAVSTDRRSWTRIAATEYADGELRMTLDRDELGGADAAWLAYFAPHSYEQNMALVAHAGASARARVRTVGTTLDGADMEVVTVRAAGASPEADAGKRSVWFIARQHPGESMASWWMEGFLARLLDDADPLAARLLDKATFHVVPNMNPDGSRRGHLRTNAAGANLNREWAAPTEDYSPEVFHVLREMHAAGLDLLLDVHGDEALPYNFIAGSEGVPGWTPRLAGLQKAFCDAFERANPDFQQVEVRARARACCAASAQALCVYESTRVCVCHSPTLPRALTLAPTALRTHAFLHMHSRARARAHRATLWMPPGRQTCSCAATPSPRRSTRPR